MKEQVPESLRHSVTPTSPHNNIALINRYLLPNKSNENLRIDPQVQANNDKTSGGCGAAAAATTTGIGLRKDSDDENENQNDNENNSEMTRAEPRRRVSLLNIPISKLRNSSAGSIEER